MFSQIRYDQENIIPVGILLVSFMPIQRLDNNRNACTNLIQYTCLTCVQKRFEEFFKCLFHERGQLSSAKKRFRRIKMVTVVGVPKVKDG